MKVALSIFFVIGLGLLGGGGAWYYYQVQVPQSWPRSEGTVVSSRVIKPRNPNQHAPEIVLRVPSGAATRQVTVRAGWNSSSYDMVKNYVDRYPAGSLVPVVINPGDESDVRYEIGPTFTNLLGPGILGIMGALFAGTALWLLIRPRRDDVPLAAEESARLGRRVAWVFAVIGAGILVLGVWLVTLAINMRRTWVPADAVSVAVQPVSSRSSVGNRPSVLIYDVQVTFRYSVGGRTFESKTTSGLASSSTSRRDALLVRFAPGSQHRIHHRPDDPNVLRYNFTAWSTFFLPGGIVLMGVIFLAFGIGASRFIRSGPD